MRDGGTHPAGCSPARCSPAGSPESRTEITETVRPVWLNRLLRICVNRISRRSHRQFESPQLVREPTRKTTVRRSDRQAKRPSGEASVRRSERPAKRASGEASIRRSEHPIGVRGMKSRFASQSLSHSISLPALENVQVDLTVKPIQLLRSGLQSNARGVFRKPEPRSSLSCNGSPGGDFNHESRPLFRARRGLRAGRRRICDIPC
jgi:hypothetical protein